MIQKCLKIQRCLDELLGCELVGVKQSRVVQPFRTRIGLQQTKDRWPDLLDGKLAHLLVLARNVQHFLVELEEPRLELQRVALQPDVAHLEQLHAVVVGVLLSVQYLVKE